MTSSQYCKPLSICYKYFQHHVLGNLLTGTEVLHNDATLNRRVSLILISAIQVVYGVELQLSHIRLFSILLLAIDEKSVQQFWVNTFYCGHHTPY